MPLNLASPGIVVREVDLTIGRVDPVSGSIGAIGATLMAGYRLFEGKKSAFYPLILIIGSIIPITFLASTYELNVKNLEERDLGAIYITAFFVIILVLLGSTLKISLCFSIALSA